MGPFPGQMLCVMAYLSDGLTGLCAYTRCFGVSSGLLILLTAVVCPGEVKQISCCLHINQ